MYKALNDFLRECEVIPPNKLGTTVPQKNVAFYLLPFGISTRLWIPLTGQKNEMGDFSVLIF
jgi:hypothetical protein